MIELLDDLFAYPVVIIKESGLPTTIYDMDLTIMENEDPLPLPNQTVLFLEG